MKQCEIIPVEDEKKFLSSYLKPYYEKFENDDPFRSKNVSIWIDIFSGSQPSSINQFYNESVWLNLNARIGNGKVSYFFTCSGTLNRRTLSYSSSSMDDLMNYLSLPVSIEGQVDEFILLTESGDRITLSPPDFDISGDVLPHIMSNTTRFLVSVVKPGGKIDGSLDDFLFEFRGQFDFPFPLPYQAVKFIVNNGNLPDEEIDELYDTIIRAEEEKKSKKVIQSKEKEKKRKKVIQPKEKEKKKAINSELKKYENYVQNLNLCEFETLKKIISSPTTIAEIAELEKYCSTHRLKSGLLDKIKEIPNKYDIEKLLKEINECEEKNRSNQRRLKLEKILFVVSLLAIIFNIVFVDILSMIIYSAVAFISFFLIKKDIKPVLFDDYTSYFINNVFK